MDKTVWDIYNTFTREERLVAEFLIAEAVKKKQERTVADVYNGMSPQKQEVLHFIIGETLG